MPRLVLGVDRAINWTAVDWPNALLRSCTLRIKWGYIFDQWKARIADRSDMTGMVIHLTKPASGIACVNEDDIYEKATANLLKILSDEVLHGSITKDGFVVGKTPAVCLQEAPLFGLIQNVEHERERRANNPKERLRYCGVGIAFSKWYVFSRGGRPVFYEKTADAKRLLPESEYWRIVNLNYDIKSNTCIDWTHEREWRVPNEFRFVRRYCHMALLHES